jgi:hypothetical protein
MILGKIPVSKFLQNLPVHFFKVLPNPKFKRNLKRIFLSWPGSSFQPIGPLSPPLALGCHPLPARLPSPAFGLPSPLPRWASACWPAQPASRPSRRHAGPAQSSSSLGRQPPSPPHMHTRAASRCPSTPATAGAPPPLITHHHHPGRSPPKTAASINIMAHHHRRPFPSDARPARSPFDPIKGRPDIPSSHRSSPAPPCPISEPRATHTEALPTAAFTADAPPLHCLPSPDEPGTGTLCSPFPPSPLVRQP